MNITKRPKQITVAWWDAFWARSWIWVEPTESGNQDAKAKGVAGTKAKVLGTLIRGYVLQRFMSAYSGRGGSPIKFNGSIFTVEMKLGENQPMGVDKDPVFRRWVGAYWFQNTRLSYRPFLDSGDGEMQEPWFRSAEISNNISKA